MSLLRDPLNPGSLRRVIAEYRHLRRDQAEGRPAALNLPDARMTRRQALSSLWLNR